MMRLYFEITVVLFNYSTYINYIHYYYNYTIHTQADNGSITDFCSFYHLPSSIIGNDKHNKLSAVYSYYQIAKTVTLTELFRDLMVLARDEGADVFNALDLMENSTVFEELKFGSGDGFLQYYLYNWKCAAMEPSKVGIVLL